MQHYTVSEPMDAISASVQTLEGCYQTLHDMAYGRAEPPNWDTLLGRMRAALDQGKEGLLRLSAAL